MDVSIATAYSGSMMVELIQQNDDSPSVFRDTVDATGYGFHHWAVTTRDFTADAAEYRALGYSAAFEVVMPELFDGGRITYFDARADVPGMIELIELNDHVERFFASIKRAADSWDGTTTTVSLSGSA